MNGQIDLEIITAAVLNLDNKAAAIDGFNIIAICSCSPFVRISGNSLGLCKNNIDITICGCIGAAIKSNVSDVTRQS